MQRQALWKKVNQRHLAGTLQWYLVHKAKSSHKTVVEKTFREIASF